MEDCVAARLAEMGVELQVLDSKDAAAYQQLRLKSYQDDPFAFSESYEDECQKLLSDFELEVKQVGTPPEWFVLGAFHKEQLIGFVKFRRDMRSKARHKSMIHAMFVDPDFRGEQVGRALIDKTIMMAKELAGLEQIHLWVLHSDQATSAHKFYKKCGFLSQGTKVRNDLKIGTTYIDAEYMTFTL